MEKLVAGILKFQEKEFAKQKHLFENLASGQKPEALFITCSDSRIDPNLITQTKPGDLFIARNAGNLVPPHYAQCTCDMDASIEFAMEVLKVRHIIVCGHTDCGAMKGALDPEGIKHLHHVTQWLSNAQSACAKVRARNNGHSHEKLLELIEENVIQQLKHLETHPSVAARMAVGDVLLHGWVYDIGTGAVFCHESDNGTFVPVSEHYANILSRNGGLLDHHAA